MTLTGDRVGRRDRLAVGVVGVGVVGVGEVGNRGGRRDPPEVGVVGVGVVGVGEVGVEEVGEGEVGPYGIARNPPTDAPSKSFSIRSDPKLLRREMISVESPTTSSRGRLARI